MKKYSIKHKKHLLSKSRKNNKKRDRNFRKKKILLNPYSNSFQNRNFEKKDYFLVPPGQFSIKTNPKGVVNFIYEVNSLLNIKQLIKSVMLNLEKVEEIDIGAICLTLSAIEQYSMLGIPFRGNEPNDKKCKEIFRNSGFLEHMRSVASSKKKSLESENAILKRGRDEINGEKSGLLIKRCMEKITGKSQHFKPVYNILGEISLNSFEHAYKKDRDKHWFLSIYYDENENKIFFVFADNGEGILNTLNRKFRKRIIENIKLINNAEILKNGFNRKYGSNFEEQPNRNKGLPSIKDKQDKNFINNLTVITNNVLLNLQEDNQIILDRNYSGTFYYWELDKNCIDKYNDSRVAV